MDELSKEDILSVQETLSSEREELLKIREDRGEYIDVSDFFLLMMRALEEFVEV